MSKNRLDEIKEEYEEYKNDYREVKITDKQFYRERCDLCKRTKSSCYDLYISFKEGLRGQPTHFEDIATVCSKECETMLLLGII